MAGPQAAQGVETQSEAPKQDMLALLLCAASAVCWGLLMFGFLEFGPQLQDKAIGKDELLSEGAKWLLAMSDPRILLVFIAGVFLILIGSFFYRHRLLAAVMFITGAVSLVWSAVTYANASQALNATPPNQPPPSLGVLPELKDEVHPPTPVKPSAPAPAPNAPSAPSK